MIGWIKRQWYLWRLDDWLTEIVEHFGNGTATYRTEDNIVIYVSTIEASVTVDGKIAVEMERNSYDTSWNYKVLHYGKWIERIHEIYLLAAYEKALSQKAKFEDWT